MNVLAIGAHPDDIELGCGATLAAHAARGDSISLLVMTPDGVSTVPLPEGADIVIGREPG